MPQRIALILFALIIWTSGVADVLAQSASSDWPKNLDQLPIFKGPAGSAEGVALDDDSKNIETFSRSRGPGGYISIFKLTILWLIFLAWVKSTDFINIDGVQTKAHYWRWNQIATVSFWVVVLLVWALNLSFYVAVPLLLVAWIVPLALYAREHNAKGDADPILTPQHMRAILAPVLRRVGIKISIEKKARAGKNAPPPLDYKPQGGATEIENQANAIKSRQLPGFADCGHLLLDALAKRATSVMLDFTREATAVRYLIDAVWTDQGPRDRPTGDGILAVMKTLAALNPEDRVTRQQGTFGIQKEKSKWQCRFVSTGTKTGERAIVQIDDGRSRKAKLTDIGMPQDLQDKLKAVVGQKNGLVLVSAPPGGGMTTMLAATVGAVDRFMRSALAMESEMNKDLEVENVPIKTYAKGGAQATLVELIRQYPDVIVVSELNDPQIVIELCEQATGGERLVVGGIRAKEAAEAPLRVMMLKVPIKPFVLALTAVVNQRLVRKLCETCREAYTPTPQMIQQLRLKPDQVTSFYRPPQPAPDKKIKPCPDCDTTGYRGVTGMFEVLIVNDAVRAAMANKPSLETIRQAALKSGMRSLQDQGIQLVAQGVTSLAEVKRVLTEKEA